MPASQATAHPSLHGLPRYLQAGETHLADGPDYYSPPPPTPLHPGQPGWPGPPFRITAGKKEVALGFGFFKARFSKWSLKG